ncbi:MAG: phenylalanine--tRNA ligase subunit alpha [Patescibacteria group bacterium]
MPINKEEYTKLQQIFADELERVSELVALEALEQTYFSRASGSFTALMKELGTLSPEERKVRGQELNQLKNELMSQLAAKRADLEAKTLGDIAESEAIDVTQPLLPAKEPGHIHPISQVQAILEDLFTSMGFMVLDGPELEDDYHNFEALNYRFNHPARDSQDTFYIKNHSDWLMRTHTSPVQIRGLKKYGAPLRAIVPGRCFRNESTDARHEHTFYQLEGLAVDKVISVAHMKGVLEAVAKCLYGNKTEVRMRPKFYPFVEPGVNGEVTCFLCHGDGCHVCKHTGWMEIFGAGMVHPNVLKAGGIDSKKYTGFAFGLGLTRLVMLKYGIEDVRHLQSGDMRFLEQF